MSIKKNTLNHLKHSRQSFTTILNETINLIRHPGALGLYCYLASKPPYWIIREKELTDHFECGTDKIRSCMKVLKNLGLITKQSIRDEQGKIVRWETTLREKPHVENPTSGEPHHLVNKERSLVNKDLKTLVDSSNATTAKSYADDERFMTFYSSYPRKEKPRDAWKAFKALKPDDQLLEKIIQDVTKRKATHITWQNDKQYISLPATYLRSAEYEGDITTKQERSNEKPTQDYGYRVVVGDDGIEYLERTTHG